MMMVACFTSVGRRVPNLTTLVMFWKGDDK